MKKIILSFVVAILVTGIAHAQDRQTGIVKLRGTRLTYPLIRKWISEFNKDYPNINVSIAQTAPADSIDISIAAYKFADGQLPETKDFVWITRYTQVPVANSERKDLAALQARGFTDKDFNDLYFKSEKPHVFASANAQPITLYTREKPACAAITFAKHFGNEASAIKGIGVKGDDQDLASAVKDDVNGLSFNNLGFVYDVTTRKVTSGLAVIPLDLNENGKVDAEEQVYGTLDELIAFIEKTNHPKFVTENVNAVFNKTTTNQATGIFLMWVLTKGQQFNHDLGFINQENTSLDQQRTTIAANFKVSAASCEGAAEVLKKRKDKTNNR
jgi:phosphate transport system substrate-binding protein